VESNITRRAYAHGKDAIASWYETDIPDVMKRFLPMIDIGFLTGDQVSIADCKFYSFLYKLQLIEDEMGGPKTAGIMNDTVRAYMQRFEALPRIKAYMASPDYQKGPLNNRHAKWGG
jgi:glutathione S-transferase